MMRRNRTYANQGRTEEEQIRGALITATHGDNRNTPRPEIFPVMNGQGWWIMRIGREGSRRPLKAEAPFFFLILEPY
jgi:hypothetical protein